MTNNYYDGGGNRVNRDRYQRLITEYLRRRQGAAPYIEDPYTQQRRFVRLPPIRRRRGASGARARSYNCGYRPRGADSATTSTLSATAASTLTFMKDSSAFEDSDKTKEAESPTKLQLLYQLKQNMEHEISKEELQKQLNEMPTPGPIKHHYNKAAEWTFIVGDIVSFHHLIGKREQ